MTFINEELPQRHGDTEKDWRFKARNRLNSVCLISVTLCLSG